MPSFDEQYRRAIQLAAQTYRLDELEKTLRSWRLNTWQVSAEGPDAWRALLAKAKRVLATGELPPHSVSADQIRELLRERQAQAAPQSMLYSCSRASSVAPPPVPSPTLPMR